MERKRHVSGRSLLWNFINIFINEPLLSSDGKVKAILQPSFTIVFLFLISLPFDSSFEDLCKL